MPSRTSSSSAVARLESGRRWRTSQSSSAAARLESSRRWRTLAAGICLESVAGMFYAVSLYSDTLGRRFQLGQSQLDWIATISFWCGSLAVYLGLINKRFGPQRTCALAAVFGVLGWGGMWAALAFQARWHCPYYVLLLLAMLQGQGMSAVDMAVVPTIASSFPECRGRALGIVKAFVGLSSSLASAAYLGFFAPTATHQQPRQPAAADTDIAVGHFMLYMTILWLAMTLMGVCLLRQPQSRALRTHAQGTTLKALSRAAYGTAALATLLILSALAPLLQVPPALATWFSGTIFALLAALALSVAMVRETAPIQSHSASHDCSAAAVISMAAPEPDAPIAAANYAPPACIPAAQPLLLNASAATAVAPSAPSASPAEATAADSASAGGIVGGHSGDGDRSGGGAASLRIGAAVEVPFTLAIRRPEFYLLMFGPLFCGGGGGLFLINNLAQISTSRGDPSEATAALLVGLTSTANCLGRVLAGVLSDWLLATHGTPRPMVLAVFMLVLSVGMLLLLVPVDHHNNMLTLLPASLLVGSSYGAHAALTPVLASELFGLRDLSLIYPVVNLGVGLGSYVFGTLLASSVYSAASHREHLPAGAPCTHQDCFTLAFVVCASAGVLAALMCLELARRSASLYQELYKEFGRCGDRCGSRMP